MPESLFRATRKIQGKEAMLRILIVEDSFVVAMLLKAIFQSESDVEVGGVAGGLLGSQVGGGSGKKAATAAGAIAGVIIGDRVANPDQPRSEQVERCREVQTSREVIKGYNVTYRYNGRDVTTTLPYQPGSTIQVGVSVIDNQQNRPYENHTDRPSYQ